MIDSNKSRLLYSLFDFVILLGLAGPYRMLGLSNLYPYVLLTCLLLVPRNNLKFKLSQRTELFVLLYVTNIILVLFFSLPYNYAPVDILSGLDNLFRPLCLLCIGYWVTDKCRFANILLLLLLGSLVLSLMLYINPALLAQVYIRWYSDPTKAMQSIRMSRSISVFASPTGLGYFSLLGILYFYNDVGKPNWLILLFFTILGMFSISKTFVLGLPLAILLSVNRSTFKTKNVFRIVAMIFLVVVILLCLQRYLYGFVDSLNYLGSQLNSGETIFGTRYNGLLIGMEDQIRETFPSGVGFVKKQLNDVFIGDSGYLIMLLWAGLPGFLLYYSSILILGTESSSALKYILIALVVELGRPALWGTRVSDVLWIIIGMEMSTGREGYD